ncbi:MAG: prepilin-type N-terminal cleavage/methylation domain-containing protein [Rubrivivax sp.]
MSMMLHRRRRQAGLSLVELMVGLAIGLVVVAGAAFVVATQLGDSRRLLLETQMQQDLRAAADIMTRDLRRTGSWAWQDGAKDAVAQSAAQTLNTFNTITVGGAPSHEISYGYSRNQAQTQFGFKLDTTSGALQSNIEGGGYQDLTDTRVMKVTSFGVSLINGPAVQLPCPNDCPGGGTACWPDIRSRQIVIDISATSVSDPSVKRSLRLATDLRNDMLTANAGGQVCPS